MADRHFFGVDFRYAEDYNGTRSDVKSSDNREVLFEWFNTVIDISSKIPVRILCVRLPSQQGSERNHDDFEASLPPDVMQTALWSPEVYYTLTKNSAGGATGLTNDPWRFILQTPRDGGPFFSLAASVFRNVAKVVYFFDSDTFDPIDLSGGEACCNYDLPLVMLPHKLLRTHCIAISNQLAALIERVKAVETTLASADDLPSDFSQLNRTLHSCNAELVYLERRSHFEKALLAAMQTIESRTRHKDPTGAWPALGPERTAISARAFDFESLPKRIENARSTISMLLQQRNQQMNIELTQASFRIAQATLSDSRSMKTIAVLTMILLPGTAVASLFSMNLFDWSAKDGSKIGSKWLWIYFVVTIPLTGAILLAWWFWNRQASRQVLWQHDLVEQEAAAAFSDAEPVSNDTPESFEMVSTRPKKEDIDR